MLGEKGSRGVGRIAADGADEFDVKPEYISLDSPLAKALLGKSIGDEVSVRTPSGEHYWLINDIRYHETEQ